MHTSLLSNAGCRLLAHRTVHPQQSPGFLANLTSSKPFHLRIPVRTSPSRASRSRESARIMATAASVSSSDASTASEDVSSKAVVLEPTTGQDGTDVLVLFLPGAFIAPSDYIPLIQALQSRCSFRLWVVILDPGNGVVMPPMVEASFDGVLKRVKEKGFKPGQLAIDNVFVGGHSWGAWSSRTVALKRAEAFIQLGSCFHTEPDNLAQYPKPVLTLTGDLDGQITLAAIVKHAGEIFATKADLGDYNMYAIKPVILIPGMNHVQIGNGIPNKQRGDLDAEIPIDRARDLVADVISCFLTVHVKGQTKEATAHALATLTQAVRRTQGLYKSFWQALEEQGKEAKKMQVELASIPGLTEKNVGVVQHDFLDNFIYSKPYIDSNAQRIIINTYLAPVGTFKVLKNLWIKMKSQEAVARALGNSEASSDVQEPLSIGTDFNRKAFDQALDLVPEALRKKFKEKGKKLRFAEDLVMNSTAEEWISSDLILKSAEDGSGDVEVQSPAVITPVQGLASRFAGMHYLKVLTVARAMHWILIDCYRQ